MHVVVVGEVHLSLNSLTGTLPSTLQKLSKLYYFSVRFNQITGTIPSFFGDLTNLQQFSVYNNKMIGTIPPELGKLQQLGKLASIYRTIYRYPDEEYNCYCC